MARVGARHKSKKPTNVNSWAFASAAIAGCGNYQPNSLKRARRSFRTSAHASTIAGIFTSKSIMWRLRSVCRATASHRALLYGLASAAFCAKLIFWKEMAGF